MRPRKEYSATEAKYEAQKIAFAPFYFQAVVTMREIGLLDVVAKHRKGISVANIAEKTGISLYAAKVLVEAGLCIDAFMEIAPNMYRLSRIGNYLRSDPMTNVNINFTNDVCYEGLFHLKESILENKPAGLKVFGDWPTIYEGLSQLPDRVKQSWFEFDHFYSDEVFPFALDIVFKEDVKTIYDIGGNTGKWARAACEYNTEVHVTMLDLPGQLGVAQKENGEKPYANRIHYHEINLLDDAQAIPAGASAVWMSQFLDCFGMEEIVSILQRVHDAIDENAFVYILEPFYNNQKFPASEHCLVGTSLYFTVIANGNSKMYHKQVMLDMTEQVGFELVECHELIGDSYHTLLKLKKKA